jgi:NADPH:quinone reductase-like Zn-dependent oxidoreductase
MGMTVIGTAGTADGLAMVKEQGADHVFNHREKDYEQKILVCSRVTVRAHALYFAGGYRRSRCKRRTRNGVGEEFEQRPADVVPARAYCSKRYTNDSHIYDCRLDNRMPWLDRFSTATHNGQGSDNCRRRARHHHPGRVFTRTCAPLAHAQGEWHEMGTFMAAAARQGWLRPIVEKSYALTSADVARAHHDVIEHASGSRGKLTIDMSKM